MSEMTEEEISRATGLIIPDPATREALGEALKQAFIRDDWSLWNIVNGYRQDRNTNEQAQQCIVHYDAKYNEFGFVYRVYQYAGKGSDLWIWRFVFNGGWTFSEHSQTWSSNT